MATPLLVLVVAGQPAGQPVHGVLELGVQVDEGHELSGQPLEADLLVAAASGQLLDPTIRVVHGTYPNASSRSRMLIYLIPEQFVGLGRVPAADPYRRALAITDFVSGMTDSYAVALFKKLTGMSLPTG